MPSDLTPRDLDELEAKAKVAKAVGWWLHDPYLAACSPDRILALIQRARRAPDA